MDINGITAIITGSGSGVGRALAREFARNGANVVVCGRRQEKIDETKKLIEDEGGACLAVSVDVTRRDQVRTLVDQTMERFGSIDLLFNNAGSFQCIGGVHEVDPEQWWRDVTINLLGGMTTIREVLPIMMKNDRGIIINMDGGRPVGGSGYACGKAGLMELNRVLLKELKEAGSSVMVFGAGPGLVRTEMTELQANSEAGKKWIPSTKEMFEAGTARAPEDIAKATIKLVTLAKPAWSGMSFGPDTDFSKK